MVAELLNNTDVSAFAVTHPHTLFLSGLTEHSESGLCEAGGGGEVIGVSVVFFNRRFLFRRCSSPSG